MAEAKTNREDIREGIPEFLLEWELEKQKDIKECLLSLGKGVMEPQIKGEVGSLSGLMKGFQEMRAETNLTKEEIKRFLKGLEGFLLTRLFGMEKYDPHLHKELSNRFWRVFLSASTWAGVAMDGEGNPDANDMDIKPLLFPMVYNNDGPDIKEVEWLIGSAKSKLNFCSTALDGGKQSDYRFEVETVLGLISILEGVEMELEQALEELKEDEEPSFVTEKHVEGIKQAA
ncbi:MAG: hypothetical protein JRK53_03035 [Deltaproteobacteria bacterium]|nr:hypothetical protein [Deltaproteobacteria bacterium]